MKPAQMSITCWLHYEMVCVHTLEFYSASIVKKKKITNLNEIVENGKYHIKWSDPSSER